MMAALLQFLASAAVIVIAGSALTRYADALADLTGLGRLLIGSVLLAAVTSLPELAVDISAVRMGANDLAVGDLMGSSVINLMILGILDLCHRSPQKMLSRVSAAHALPGVLSIGLTAIACGAIALGSRFPLATIAGIGPGPLLIAVVYTLGMRLVYLDQRTASHPTVGGKHDVPIPAGQKMTLARAVTGFVVAGVAILAAGPFLASSADQLAAHSGLGRTFVGSVFVALCTSLPELVTSIAAVRLGAFELAVGNIFGSNAFNMVILLPLDAVSPGALLSQVSHSHAVTGLCAIGITCVAIAGQLYHEEKRRKLLEPDALLVIGLCIASMLLIYALR